MWCRPCAAMCFLLKSGRLTFREGSRVHGTSVHSCREAIEVNESWRERVSCNATTMS